MAPWIESDDGPLLYQLLNRESDERTKMGQLTEKLKALTVRASSPDGLIDGTLHAWEETVEISFQNDSYDSDYTEQALSHQLSRLLDLLAVGRLRGRAQAAVETGWRKRDFSKPHWDKQQRDFEEAALDAETIGASSNERICLVSVAMRTFTVTVKSGTLDELDEQEFCSEFASAVKDLISDWQIVTSELRKHYLPDEHQF